MHIIDKGKNWVQSRPLIQALLLFLLVLSSSCALLFTNQSMLAFFLLLASLPLLSITSFHRRIKWGAMFTILVVILPLSVYGSPSEQAYMEIAVMTGIYIALALGLNVVVGFAGLLDLGFIAFFAIGAYTYGIVASPQAQELFSSALFPLSGAWFWPFVIIGGIIATFFGVLLGMPVLRVRGDYLAIVTLGFGEIIRIIFNNLDHPVNITNGALGLSSIQSPQLFHYSFSYASQIYFIVLAILILIVLVVNRIEHSQLGRAFKAVREDEIAARAVGIPLVRTKLWAFAIGASFSGLMGVVFAAKQQFIDPTSFTLLESITVLVMVILGGMGSVTGVILGATLMTVLNLQILNELAAVLNQLFNVPSALSPDKMQKFIFGLVLVLIAIFRPQGLIPARNRKIDPFKLK